MKIRKGKIQDLKELKKILTSSPELEAEPYTDKMVKTFLTDKKRNLVLIAEENKKIAGFIMAELWLSKGYSYFEDIYVNPEFRRKGVASKLMATYEKICKNKKIELISCLVLTTNKPMHKLMKNLKYAKGSPFYYFLKKLK